MANRNEKNPGNASGAYYVDSSCIDCDRCRETAPASFRRNDEMALSIVFHQPMTKEEVERAREALEGCPSESIGDDGAE